MRAEQQEPAGRNPALMKHELTCCSMAMPLLHDMNGRKSLMQSRALLGMGKSDKLIFLIGLPI